MEVSDAIVEKGKAGYAGVYLHSSEEQRTLAEIVKAAKVLDRKVFIWSLGRGLFEEGKKLKVGEKPKPVPDTEMPNGVLDTISNGDKETVPQKSIVVLKLFHHFLDDPMAQTRLIEIHTKFKTALQMLIILTPVLKIPPELDKEFSLVEVDLPTQEVLDKVLSGITDELDEDKRPSTEQRKLLINSALGLTTTEAENAFSLSVARPKMRSTALWDPKVVMDEKCATLKKTGLLEYIPVEEGGLSVIGGLDNLKEFVRLRKSAFSEAARAYGLPMPKGVLLIGVPGTGKSLGARALSAELKQPLIKLDMGKVYGGVVGESEGNIRRALQTAEALAPCILWIDEIEKGMATGSGQTDSGVGQRVQSTVLTWMQERKAPVWVYATANSPTLPPEMMRKGRFDELFSVDLPTAEERGEIFRIHLEKRKRQQEVLQGPNDLRYLTEGSAGFNGAEIESAIEAGMFASFNRNASPLQLHDVINALDETVPQSITLKASIEKIREWCRGRTRPANKGAEVGLGETEIKGRRLEA